MYKLKKTNLSYDTILDFAPCRIGARFFGEALVELNYLPPDAPLTRHPDHRARHLVDELQCYLNHPAHVFDLLFVPSGTPFQLRVWRALLGISAGQTLNYGDLATQLKTAPRAVGQACGSNPLPLVIPCHRVVSAAGLGGFMHAANGAPLDIKAWLLKHEIGDSASGAVPSPQPSSKGRGVLPGGGDESDAHTG